MTSINRRNFIKLSGAAGLATTLPIGMKSATASTPSPKHVVVVGGGYGGATVAKYLRLWSNYQVSVTLVDPRAGVSTTINKADGLYQDGHYSCILSNLVVTGQIPSSRIRIGYDQLASPNQPGVSFGHGVTLVKGLATGINTNSHELTVALVDGTGEVTGQTTISYDRIIFSPGVDFISPPGTWDPSLNPHAWQAGPQTLMLKSQLSKMTSTGTFIMTVPKAPYRCPPGPYERACVIADYLKRNKSGAKIIVLDENTPTTIGDPYSAIQAEPVGFKDAFVNRFKGTLAYYSGVVITNVVSSNNQIDTNVKSWSKTQGNVQVLNIIPNQRAGKVLYDLGMLDATSRWAVVDALSYGLIDTVNFPDIHVIGDAQTLKPASLSAWGNDKTAYLNYLATQGLTSAGQPKSGSMANAQAKVCANAILQGFGFAAATVPPATNSACYSPITKEVASWLTANYQYEPFSNTMARVTSSFGEAPTPTSDGYQQMYGWYDNIVADAFK